MSEPLTEREIEILRLAADGCANGEIAVRLSLSLNTVKWYTRRIYEKLAVESRTQAIQRAHTLGLLVESNQPAKPTQPSYNLPSPLTTFVGRRTEIDAVKQLLKQHRLLTMTGPGGIGKTRLAIQVAAEMSGFYPDGVCFVDLAAINEATLVTNTIAHLLGVAESLDTPLTSLIQTALSHKHFLLILDNFEHLLDAAPLVADLLATCRQLTVLITSREVLALYGEQEYAVPPLQLPDLEGFAAHHLVPTPLLTSEALQLFEHCAQAAYPAFRLTVENVPAVASICLRLDGLPLAIELAAAYVKLLSPQAILTQLDSLWLEMKRPLRNIPARQQTLRNAIEWSYRFLDEEERRMFAQLAVFRGGCTWEAINVICTSDAQATSTVVLLEPLNGLINKSLVWRRTDGNGQPRFGMLATIREYALSCLQARDEVEMLRQRHAHYYAHFVQQLGERLYSAASKGALDQLNQIADDVTGAWQWLLQTVEASTSQPLTATWLAQLIPTLAESYYMQARFQEGQQRFVQAANLLRNAGWSTAMPNQMVQPSPQLTVFAQLQVRIAMLRYELDQYEAALQTIEATLPSLQAWGNAEELALAYLMLGKANYRCGQRDQARAHLQRSLHHARTIPNRLGQAAALNNLSHLAEDEADFVECEQLLRQCLAIYDQMNYPFGIGTTLGNLGYVYNLQGKFEEALPYLHRSLTIAEQEGDSVSKLINLSHIANAERAQGRRHNAVIDYQRSLALAQELGKLRSASVNLNGLSQTYLDAADLSSAIDCLVEALALARQATSTPDTLMTLSLCAQVWRQQGKLEAALQALAFVGDHPATTIWMKQIVQPLFEELAQEAAPTIVAQAQQWASTQALEDVIAWAKTLIGSTHKLKQR